jgi:hypothetical protein
MAGRKRKRLTPALESAVLIRSRRMCCVCVAVKGDISAKKLQIAHLDGDPSNNAKSNLVALCHDHHDDHDTVSRQSKKLTKGEIVAYRGKLDVLIEQRDQQVILPAFLGTPDHKDVSPNAQVLGQVIAAQDIDLTQLAKFHRPNGIRITRLGIHAAADLGDFDTAIEALAALMRLEVASTKKGGWATFWARTSPTATPGTGALALLAELAKLDWTLHDLAVRRMRMYALVEDEDFKALGIYQDLPRPSFLPTVNLLAARALDQGSPEIADSTLRHLAGVVLGLGVGLSSRGIGMPPPPARILMDASGNRLLEDTDQRELAQLVSACNTVARLPAPLFAHLISSVPQDTGMPPVTQSTPTNASRSQAMSFLRSCALLPRWALIAPIRVGSSHDAKALSTVRDSLEGTYQTVSSVLKAFLTAEHRLVQSGR